MLYSDDKLFNSFSNYLNVACFICWSNWGNIAILRKHRQPYHDQRFVFQVSVEISP